MQNSGEVFSPIVSGTSILETHQSVPCSCLLMSICPGIHLTSNQTEHTSPEFCIFFPALRTWSSHPCFHWKPPLPVGKGNNSFSLWHHLRRGMPALTLVCPRCAEFARLMGRERGCAASGDGAGISRGG